MSHKGTSTTTGYIAAIEKAPPVDERKLEVIDIYCAQFGCGNKLTLIEKLCGYRCTEHMKKKGFAFSQNY